MTVTQENSQLDIPDHGMSDRIDSTEQPAYPRVTETVEDDVAVVGAGIAGISTVFDGPAQENLQQKSVSVSE